MTLFSALLIFITVSCFVAGQILMKQASDLAGRENYSRVRVAAVFAAAIAAFSVNFFLNIGLLQRFALSYFFPFQGLSVILVVCLGAVVLKERVSLNLTIGSAVIGLGVFVVSLS